MDFLSPVDAQHDICHLFIAEFYDLIIQQNAVRRQRKAEFLVMQLFLLSSVFYKVFYDLPVHQRFSAEKIHFQIPSGPGICNQKVKRLFADLIAHERAASVVLSLFRKTVPAGKVAVMRNMQAQRFYYSFACLIINDRIFIDVLRKQHARFRKLAALLKCFRDLCLLIRSLKLLCRFFLCLSFI